MSIQDLGAVGELLAAVATLVTLIYLAAQIRQNTIALRNGSRLDTRRALTDWYSLVMSDQELMRVWNRVFVENAELSLEERTRFVWMMSALTSRIEEIHSQYLSGLIDTKLWLQYRGVMAGFLQNHVVKEWWDSGATVFSEDFRSAVDSVPANEASWSGAKVKAAMEGSRGDA